MKKLKTFAHNLDKLRKEQRKSLTEFAQEIGIPKSTMQSIMKDGNTTLDTAVRIASALDIPLDSLLSDDLSHQCAKTMAHEAIMSESIAPEAIKQESTKPEIARDSKARRINAAKEMLTAFDRLDREEQLALEYYIVRIMEILEKKK